jgi:hypothetical protein
VSLHLDCKRHASHSTERADYQQDALDAIGRQHALTVAGDGGYGHVANVKQANSMIAKCGKHLDTWQKSVRLTFSIYRDAMITLN